MLSSRYPRDAGTYFSVFTLCKAKFIKKNFRNEEVHCFFYPRSEKLCSRMELFHPGVASSFSVSLF